MQLVLDARTVTLDAWTLALNAGNLDGELVRGQGTRAWTGTRDWPSESTAERGTGKRRGEGEDVESGQHGRSGVVESRRRAGGGEFARRKRGGGGDAPYRVQAEIGEVRT
jgi:hypothetical protein